MLQVSREVQKERHEEGAIPCLRYPKNAIIVYKKKSGKEPHKMGVERDDLSGARCSGYVEGDLIRLDFWNFLNLWARNNTQNTHFA